MQGSRSREQEVQDALSEGCVRVWGNIKPPGIARENATWKKDMRDGRSGSRDYHVMGHGTVGWKINIR